MAGKCAQSQLNEKVEMRRIHIIPSIPQDYEIADFKRIAAAERAEAVRVAARAVSHWLRQGLRLRYSDDALTHPAAGKLCGC